MASTGASSSVLRLYIRQCLFTNNCHSSRPHHALRTFTSTCQRQRAGLLANFPPTSSPELDSTIAALREHIFLPNHLQSHHRDLMMRPSLHHFLMGEEPVFATVRTADARDSSKKSEEQIQLAPRTKHSPSHAGKTEEKLDFRKTMKKLVSLLSTGDDFRLLPALLREFRAARKVVRQEDISRIIRRAAEQGQYGCVLELIGKGGSEGVVVDSAETAKEVMLLCLQRGVAGGWDEKETESALRHADAALREMKMPKHAPDGVQASQAARAENVGVALALAGIRATKFKDRMDEDGKVATFAAEFLEYWPRTKIGGMTTRTTTTTTTALEDLEEGLSSSKAAQQIRAANAVLIKWVPSWVGVQLALRVIKDETQRRELGEIFDDNLATAVGQAVKVLEESPKGDNGKERRGLIVYNALLKAL